MVGGQARGADQPGALPQGADHPPLRRYHRSTTLANPARIYPLTGVLYCATQHSPLRGRSRSNGGDSRYYVDRLCQQRLAKAEWHQSNLRADWIERKIQDLVTSIRLPADYDSDRILTYLFYDEDTDGDRTREAGDPRTAAAGAESSTTTRAS